MLHHTLTATYNTYTIDWDNPTNIEIRYDVPHTKNIININIEEIIQLIKNNEPHIIERKLIEKILQKLELPIMKELIELLLTTTRILIRKLLEEEKLEKEYENLLTIYLLYLIEKIIK